MKCKVCSHPQLAAIDHALLGDNATFAALSGQYDLSISSLFRHKKSLTLKMARAQENLQHQLRQDTLFRYNDYLETTREVVRTASADGDTRQTLRAVREGTRILNFITKLEVKFTADTVYRILASPQYTTQDSLLPTNPEFITGGHQTLARDLFSPCPEIPADPELVAWDEEDAVAADQAKISSLDTPPLPGLSLELPPQILPRLGQLEATPTQPENHAPIQREKSAKLPRHSRSSNKNKQQYQSDKHSKKTAAKSPPVGRESQAPPAVKPSRKRPPHPPNPPLETPQSEPETPHESLFVRLRRKWAKTPPPAPRYSCDSEQLYEEYLQKESEALAQPAPPPAPPDRPSKPENPQPETPKPLKFLHPVDDAEEYNYALTHGHRRENRPQYIPDRRWEEDFGNPRKIKGCY